MNDVSKNIRAFVFTTINGNITFSAANVPCYTKAPPKAAYPYIIVKNTGMIDDPTKDKTGGVYEFSVRVDTRFEKNKGGQDDVDDISNSITGLLRTLGTHTSDFGSDTMWLLKMVSERYLEDDDDQYHYYSKILTFEAHVCEN